MAGLENSTILPLPPASYSYSYLMPCHVKIEKLIANKLFVWKRPPGSIWGIINYVPFHYQFGQHQNSSKYINKLYILTSLNSMSLALLFNYRIRIYRSHASEWNSRTTQEPSTHNNSKLFHFSEFFNQMNETAAVGLSARRSSLGDQSYCTMNNQPV